MKISLALLLGVAFARQDKNAWREEINDDWSDLDHVAAFEDWQLEFGKSYWNLEEESHRFLIFLDNWEFINKFNIEGAEPYTMKLNQFSDLTNIEFAEYVSQNGACSEEKYPLPPVVITESIPVRDPRAPTAIDWTNYNGKSYVTPVKNQGSCGSCWSFATTGTVESRYAIAKGVTGANITTLSEQQLCDCSTSYGNHGCGGGNKDNAFKYIEAEGGLCSEKEYPYTAKNSNTCKASSCGTKYDPITSYKDVTPDSEPSLVNAVADGPVGIRIEADQTAFQHYSSGVLTGTCGTKLDHEVLTVGYGTTTGGDYWKVKNSWGPSWGMDGYVLICRNCGKNGNKGQCGILMGPSYVTPS